MADHLGRVAVLYGGVSAEREVSLRSGQGVLAALQAQGVDAIGFDPSARPLHELRDEGVERVFIALHGRYGEDGTVQGALEVLGIPYTGSGVMASAVAMDKTLSKRIWLSHDLPTPRYEQLDAQTLQDPVALMQRVAPLGYPLIIKPPHEGSTIGVTKVLDASGVIEACRLALQFDEVVLAEEFIEGPELTVTILGSGAQAQALPIVEIRAPAGNYDFENKYNTDVVQYLCPAPLSSELTGQIQHIALAAFRTLGCAGWARVDVMLQRQSGRPYLLEINTSPGMTDHSLVPMAARAAGMSYGQLCQAIAQTAALKVRQVNKAGVSAQRSPAKQDDHEGGQHVA